MFAYHQWRGDCYYRLGQWSKALADFELIVKLNPRDAWGRFDRALARRATGNLDGAVEDFNEAIRILPGHGVYRFERRTGLAGAREYRLAVADFDKAIELGHTAAEVYEARAACRASWAMPRGPRKIRTTWPDSVRQSLVKSRRRRRSQRHRQFPTSAAISISFQISRQNSCQGRYFFSMSVECRCAGRTYELLMETYNVARLENRVRHLWYHTRLEAQRFAEAGSGFLGDLLAAVPSSNYSGNTNSPWVIQAYDANGNSVGPFTTINFPTGATTTTVGAMALAPDGNVYVGEYYGVNNGGPGNAVGLVQEFNGTTGAFIKTIVPGGSGGLGAPTDWRSTDRALSTRSTAIRPTEPPGPSMNTVRQRALS